MAEMPEEEHLFIKMYKFFLKIFLEYTSYWVHFSTKFNGVLHLKNIEKVAKKGVQKSMFFGSIIWKVENWEENNDFLSVKQFQM